MLMKKLFIFVFAYKKCILYLRIINYLMAI